MVTLSLARRALAISASRRTTVSQGKRGFAALLTISEEYPDLPNVTPTPAEAGTYQSSKLECGLTIATEDASSTSTVTLTFPNGGSSSELGSESGAAFANKCFAFKSACGLSSVALLRAIEDGGGSPFTSASRYNSAVGYTASPESAIGLVGAVIAATNSSFERWDVKETVALSNKLADEAKVAPEVVLTEQMYAAAYGAQSSFGKPFYDTVSELGLVSFRERTYAVNGAVLAATGIEDHTAFVAGVLEALEEGNPKSLKKAEETGGVVTSYMGGEGRMKVACSGNALVAICMKGPSGSPALTGVLKHCFSLKGVSAFAAPGLVGVYGSASAADAGNLTDSLCAALTSPISVEVVAKAKVLAKAEAMFALDGGSKGLAEAMTSDILYTGSLTTHSTATAYDSISEKDVKAAVAAMLKTNPSLAAVGEIDSVPYHATVASRFS